MTDRPFVLPEKSEYSASMRLRLAQDFERFALGGLPTDLPTYILETYGVDVSGSYAGRTIRCPIGKGSGQLSMNLHQVKEAAEAGLGFVILKTVIAQDQAGQSSMDAWTIHAPRMVVEPIQGRESGEWGWTVTWKGRGWSESFEAYLNFVAASLQIGNETGLLVVPSVKYHLPQPGEEHWRSEEYNQTTSALLDVAEPWRDASSVPLIEKDFSPTLAGSDRASSRLKVIEWLSTVPRLIREAAGNRPVQVGLKLFNALDDDEFQLEMLESVHRQADRPDFVIYANRLFDPNREFDGARGVAYGGPDLSDRNLRILSRFREQKAYETPLEISATGDVSSGKMAVEYLLRGCTSFQIHTGFQLPMNVYPMRLGSKLVRSLHRLYFDPETGLIPWLLHVGEQRGLARDGVVRLLDLAASATQS